MVQWPCEQFLSERIRTQRSKTGGEALRSERGGLTFTKWVRKRIALDRRGVGICRRRGAEKEMEGNGKNWADWGSGGLWRWELLVGLFVLAGFVVTRVGSVPVTLASYKRGGAKLSSAWLGT